MKLKHLYEGRNDQDLFWFDSSKNELIKILSSHLAWAQSRKHVDMSTSHSECYPLMFDKGFVRVWDTLRGDLNFHGGDVQQIRQAVKAFNREHKISREYNVNIDVEEGRSYRLDYREVGAFMIRGELPE